MRIIRDIFYVGILDFYVTGKIHILTHNPREIGVYACSQYLNGNKTRVELFSLGFDET